VRNVFAFLVGIAPRLALSVMWNDSALKRGDVVAFLSGPIGWNTRETKPFDHDYFHQAFSATFWRCRQKKDHRDDGSPHRAKRVRGPRQVALQAMPRRVTICMGELSFRK